MLKHFSYFFITAIVGISLPASAHPLPSVNGAISPDDGTVDDATADGDDSNTDDDAFEVENASSGDSGNSSAPSRLSMPSTRRASSSSGGNTPASAGIPLGDMMSPPPGRSYNLSSTPSTEPDDPGPTNN